MFTFDDNDYNIFRKMLPLLRNEHRVMKRASS